MGCCDHKACLSAAPYPPGLSDPHSLVESLLHFGCAHLYDAKPVHSSFTQGTRLELGEQTGQRVAGSYHCQTVPTAAQDGDYTSAESQIEGPQSPDPDLVECSEVPSEVPGLTQ